MKNTLFVFCLLLPLLAFAIKEKRESARCGPYTSSSQSRRRTDALRNGDGPRGETRMVVWRASQSVLCRSRGSVLDADVGAAQRVNRRVSALKHFARKVRCDTNNSGNPLYRGLTESMPEGYDPGGAQRGASGKYCVSPAKFGPAAKAAAAAASASAAAAPAHAAANNDLTSMELGRKEPLHRD